MFQTVLALVAITALTVVPSSQIGTWQPIGTGVEHGTFRLVKAPEVGDGILHVVRVDPDQVELRMGLASEQTGAPRTAADWARTLGLSVVMNAGMFGTDFKSNVGYLRNGSHLNNSQWNKKYLSALGFGPKHRKSPAMTFVDLDSKGGKEAIADHQSVVQNLRLIKGDGQNVWKPNERRWSEAAIAVDRRGRLLFLFSRSPMTMYDFSNRLLQLPLDIVRAMHVEGGPEASLSIRSAAVSMDLSGSYETGFHENDDNEHQWPLPNVIGVVAQNKPP